MQTEHDAAVRRQLAGLLQGGNSHAGFDQAVDDFPVERRGSKPGGAPHSAWELVEHLRIAQHDILEFCRNPQHESPEWPSGYWPAVGAPPKASAWDESVRQFRADLKSFIELISDTKHDLFAPIPHAPEKQTLLREALVLADHNSYHVGQIFLVRKMEGA